MTTFPPPPLELLLLELPPPLELLPPEFAPPLVLLPPELAPPLELLLPEPAQAPWSTQTPEAETPGISFCVHHSAFQVWPP